MTDESYRIVLVAKQWWEKQEKILVILCCSRKRKRTNDQRPRLRAFHAVVVVIVVVVMSPPQATTHGLPTMPRPFCQPYCNIQDVKSSSRGRSWTLRAGLQRFHNNVDSKHERIKSDVVDAKCLVRFGRIMYWRECLRHRGRTDAEESSSYCSPADFIRHWPCYWLLVEPEKETLKRMTVMTHEEVRLFVSLYVVGVLFLFVSTITSSISFRLWLSQRNLRNYFLWAN